MGADGHIHITNPKEVEDFVMNVLEDAIYKSLKSQYPPEDSYDLFNVNLSENDLVILFLSNDEEVSSEEIIIKTIKMDSSYYWIIYNYLVKEFNNSLNNHSIPSRAWDCCNDSDKFQFEIELASISANNLNYTYWDTEGSYDATMYEFFEGFSDTAPIEIYHNTINHTKKCDWYKTFIEIFPFDFIFIQIMEQYKYNVELNSVQMWT